EQQSNLKANIFLALFDSEVNWEDIRFKVTKKFPNNNVIIIPETNHELIASDYATNEAIKELLARLMKSALNNRNTDRKMLTASVE
ncbi:MAG: hypothetical protein WCK31_03595, partial [bacterium]